MYRLRLLIIFICSVLLLAACKPIRKDNTLEAQSIWSSVSVVSEHDIQYYLNNTDNDTSVIYIYHQGSFFAPVKKLTVDTLTTRFSRAEKDSVYDLVKALILYPAKTNRFCTDYVGSLKLFIDYGQFKQTGTYSSVCDWTTLSDTTRKLDGILSRHLKMAIPIQYI